MTVIARYSQSIDDISKHHLCNTTAKNANPQITITILYFASACDATGLSSESLTFPLPQIRIHELEEKLKDRHEKLKSMLDICMFAVNMEYCGRDDIVKEGDEVAIIPPVSGG